MKEEINAREITSVYAQTFAGQYCGLHVVANGEIYLIEHEALFDFFKGLPPLKIEPKKPRQKYRRITQIK